MKYYILLLLILTSCHLTTIDEVEYHEIKSVVLRDKEHVIQFYDSTIVESFCNRIEFLKTSNCPVDSLRISDFIIGGYIELIDSTRVHLLVVHNNSNGIIIRSQRKKFESPELTEYIYHLMGHDSRYIQHSRCK